MLAARLAHSNYYDWQNSVTEMLNTLGWPTLESRRYNSRLIQMHKIIHNHTSAM